MRTFDNLPYDLAVQVLHLLKLSKQLTNVLCLSCRVVRLHIVRWYTGCDILSIFLKIFVWRISAWGPSYGWLSCSHYRGPSRFVQSSHMRAFFDLFLLGKIRALLVKRGRKILEFLQRWFRIHKISIYFDKSCSITFRKLKILKFESLINYMVEI